MNKQREHRSEENMQNQTTKEIITSYINEQKADGHFNDYVSKMLLDNIETLNTIMDGFLQRQQIDKIAMVDVCRTFLEQHCNMLHDYQGYGEFALPLSKQEALQHYDSEKPVYLIYSGDTEALAQSREDVENADFFTMEMSNELKADLKKLEFIRCLEKAGYQFVGADTHNPDRIFKDGQEIMVIDEENQMRYRPEKRKEACEIFDMRQNIFEYVTAFQSAKNADASLTQNYYSILDWNGIVLGAKQMQNNSFQFVTWEKDKSGNGYNHGHYETDFETAKQDFAVRSGLIDSNKMFSETEMKIIRSGLVKYTELDGALDFEKEKAIKSVVSKIDTQIVPEILNEQEDCEEMGEDAELEL